MLHDHVSSMALNSQLYLQVVPCHGSVIVMLVIIIIERTHDVLRCTFTMGSADPAHPVHTPTLEPFSKVMRDVKLVCDAMRCFKEVEVTALTGWGTDLFEQSREALHNIFILSDQTADKQPPMMYTILGRYPGTRRLNSCECQRYTRTLSALSRSSYVSHT